MRFDRRVYASTLVYLVGPLAIGAVLGFMIGQAIPAAQWALVPGCTCVGAVVALLRMRTLLPTCARLVDRVCSVRPRMRVLRALLDAAGPVEDVDLVKAARVPPTVLRRSLKRLEAEKLITGTASDGGWRRMYQLTEQGASVARIWTVALPFSTL